jgi:hypothetical protein
MEQGDTVPFPLEPLAELPDMPPFEHYVFQMIDGNMANPQPLYGACVRTAEVVCTTRTSFGHKRYHVRVTYRMPLIPCLTHGQEPGGKLKLTAVRTLHAALMVLL